MKPNLIKKNGDHIWIKNGKLHRNNDLRFPKEHANLHLLQIIKSNGTQGLHQNDKRHRDNDLRVPKEHIELLLLP